MIKKLFYLALLMLLPYVMYTYGANFDVLPASIEIPPDPSPFQASLTIHNFVRLNEEFWVRTYDISVDYPLLTLKKSNIRQAELDEIINRPEVKMIFGDLSPYIPKRYPREQ
jgi:hypothetical protein